jgi:hypothetical protein
MLKTAEIVIGHWVTFIKGHEKLLLAVIAALVLIHLGDKAYDAYGKKLTNEQLATNAQIVLVEKSNADIQAKLEQLKATVELQAKIDDAKIAAAKQRAATAVKVDAALPLPDLSKHWEDMLKLPSGSIAPQTNGTVAVATDAAHTTVAELEKIPSLTEELNATQDKFTGCVAVKTQLETQVIGLKNSIDLEKQGRAEDAKVAKHNQRKSYMRGLKHGFIIGVGVAIAVKAFIIH